MSEEKKMEQVVEPKFEIPKHVLLDTLLEYKDGVEADVKRMLDREEVLARREFFRKVSRVQGELKVAKGQWNPFGKYNFRNLEDILAAVKPILAKEELVLTITDRIVYIGDRFYVEATATITDGIVQISAQALSREEATKKGMDGSQITGAASSYARKLAVGGLLEISGSKDMDSLNQGPNQGSKGDNLHAPQVTKPPQAPVQPRPAKPAQVAKPNPESEERQRLLKEISARAAELKYSNEIVTQVIIAQFHKKSSKELTLAEITALHKNLEFFVKQLTEQKSA